MASESYERFRAKWSQCVSWFFADDRDPSTHCVCRRLQGIGSQARRALPLGTVDAPALVGARVIHWQGSQSGHRPPASRPAVTSGFTARRSQGTPTWVSAE